MICKTITNFNGHLPILTTSTNSEFTESNFLIVDAEVDPFHPSLKILWLLELALICFLTKLVDVIGSIRLLNLGT